MKNLQNPKHSRLILLRLALVLIAYLFSSQVQANQLQARVDRQTISVNESLTLTLRYNGNINSSPDLQSLNRDFDILSQNQSSQFRSINGNTESFTDWVVTLMPRREGKLQIPSFSIGNAVSNSLTITVTPEEELPEGELKDIFIETILEKDNSFVQEQVRITYRLYFSKNIEALDRDPLELENVVMEELPDIRYRRNVDGNPYSVFELSYALYPQTSGTLTIPAINWVARVSQSGHNRFGFSGGRYEIKRLRTQEMFLQVNAKPDTFPAGATWLPSSKITIEESWSKAPSSLVAGEPITRTITLKAEGLSSSQLPIINSQKSSNNLKFYGEQPALDDEKSSYGITATRTEKYAIMANKAGEVTIPAIKIPWWDVESQKLQYAELPAYNLVATPGATANEPTNFTPQETIPEDETATTTTQAAVGGYWKVLSLLTLLTTVIFFGLWVHTRNKLNTLTNSKASANAQQHRKAKLKEAQAFEQIKNACKQSDANQVKKALVDWVTTVSNNNSSLANFATTSGSVSLQTELRNLDETLYGNASSKCDYTALITALEEWRTGQKNATTTKSREMLSPLYNA